jgi:hypothetical protein
MQITATPMACPPEADVAYHEGIAQLGASQNDAAAASFARALAICPTHPYAAELQRIAASRSMGTAATPPAPAQPGGPERPDAFARSELVIGQTAHGMGQGVLMCLAAHCNFQVTLGASLVGGVLGLGASYFASESGVTLGQAITVNAGTSWGGMNALFLAMTAFGAGASFSGETVLAMEAGGALLGTAVGTGLAISYRPHSGHAALAASAGMWSGVMALWLAIAFTDARVFSSREGALALGITELLAANGALVAAALLAPQVRISRTRVTLIDTAGLIGTLAGAVTGLLFASGVPSSSSPFTVFGLVTALGTGAGLATGVLVTRGTDPQPSQAPVARRRIEPRFSAAPLIAEGAQGISLGMVF